MAIKDFLDAGTITGAVSGLLNYASTASTNKANADIAERQNQWNLDMWQRQNAYNDPKAQMSRLRQAGVNPALAYSEGGMMNEAAPAAEAVGSQVRSFYLDPLTMAQIANINADTDKKKSETETENMLREPRYQELIALSANMNMQCQDIVSKIGQRSKQNELTDAQIKDISFNQMLKVGQFELDKARLANETKLTDAQVDKLAADRDLALANAQVSRRTYDEMVWTFAVRLAGLEAQVNLTSAQTSQAEATAKKLGCESALIDLEREVKSNDPDLMMRTAEGRAMAGERGTGSAILTMVKYQVKDALRSIGFSCGVHATSVSK